MRRFWKATPARSCPLIRRRAGCGDEVGARAVALRQPINLEAIKLARSAQALAGSRNLVVFPGLGGVLVPRRSAGIQGNTRPLLGLGLAQQVAPVRRDALTFARWRGGHVAPVLVGPTAEAAAE